MPPAGNRFGETPRDEDAMDLVPFSKLTTRREMLRATSAVAGGALLARLFPGTLLAGAAPRPMAYPQQAGAAPADPLAAMRAQMGATPLETLELSDTLIMLSGPGGNVVVLNGPDGKVIVDSFVQTVWGKLRQTLDGMGNTPMRLLIDTHWHFDHTDNNANFRATGAQILAHENTKKRLSEPHDLLGMHFAPSPANALPTQTFTATHRMQANGENLVLGYIPPAHTDTDIYVQYQRANVIHLGDTFFNGMYPFIDAGTGGNINGMIASANRILGMVDSNTKIVPGHGPLGDRAALTRYRDVLVAVRDRVQREKSAGKSVQEVVAAKPTAEFDATWGMGFMQPDVFVAIVYSTL
jgi:glyoxylase-like metal-dependent hydrolase (beta-lactamase superfamily II)